MFEVGRENLHETYDSARRVVWLPSLLGGIVATGVIAATGGFDATSDLAFDLYTS